MLGQCSLLSSLGYRCGVGTTPEQGRLKRQGQEARFEVRTSISDSKLPEEIRRCFNAHHPPFGNLKVMHGVLGEISRV